MGTRATTGSGGAQARAGLTCALEVETDVLQRPHHELQLQQEGEDAAVPAQAALGDDDVEGPVNLRGGSSVDLQAPSPARPRCKLC